MQFRHVQLAQNHMATTFTFTVSAAEKDLARADRVLSEAHRMVTRLERELSEFLPTSAVARLNRAATGERVAAPASLLELLDRCEALRERTRGAFDCTAKTRGGKAGAARVAWDEASGEAWMLLPGTHVGFGAIGKGYALDRVRALLEREGFSDFLLNAGGSSIVLSGFAAPGLPWSWAWSWKRDSDGTYLGVELAHATGEAIALGVSGLMEKGQHLIDPRTRAPAVGLQSALVGHKSAATADALSTALFILGWDEGMRHVPDPVSEPAVAVIDNAEVPAWNGGFQRLWGGLSSLVGHASVWLFALLAASPAFAQDGGEAVDLSALGLSDFTPYIVERNSWWILLPALVLGMVILHVVFPSRKAKAKR